MVFDGILTDYPDSTHQQSASTLANESFFSHATKTNAYEPSSGRDAASSSAPADNLASPAVNLSSREKGTPDEDLDSQFERDYVNYVDHHTPTRTEILREQDPRRANQISLQANQLELGVRDGFSHRLDNFYNPDTRTEAIANTGLSFAGAAGLSFGLVRLGKAAPEAARAIGKVFKYAFLADAAYEIGSAAYAGFETWKHPEDYLQNTTIVANTLGSATFDYATIGAASGFGYVAGELTFGLGSLDFKLSSFSTKTPVPKLEFDPFMARPKPVAEPSNTALADLYLQTRSSVVRVNNGSGVIIDANEGLIATNAHVGAGRESHYATTYGNTRLNLRPIAIDRAADLMIYKPTFMLSKPLPSAEIAPIESLQPGKKLFPVGHPAGSVRPYIYEALVKSERPGNLSRTDKTPRIALIEMKAPAVPGDSGSPIFDELGRVVAQISQAEAHKNELYGPSSAHLSEMLRVVRENPSPTGWLDIKTRAEFSATDGGSEKKLTMSSEFEHKSDDSFTQSTKRKAHALDPYTTFGSEFGLARIPGTAAILSEVPKAANWVFKKPK